MEGLQLCQIFPSSYTNVCTICLTPNATKVCSKCKTKRYCSKECQSLDWKQHKPLCGSVWAKSQSVMMKRDDEHFYVVCNMNIVGTEEFVTKILSTRNLYDACQNFCITTWESIPLIIVEFWLVRNQCEVQHIQDAAEQCKLFIANISFGIEETKPFPFQGKNVWHIDLLDGSHVQDSLIKLNK